MEQILVLAVATAVLVMIPGPNVALIVGRSLQHGIRAGIATTVGTTIGVALQLVLVFAGIAALIEQLASALTVLRWAGVFYLLWLAVMHWRQPADELQVPDIVPARVDIGRGVLLAAINPKVLVFNAAFLPQFVDPARDTASQFAVLCAVYLSVLFIGDSLWAIFAASARHWFARFSRVRHRLSAIFFAGAGIGLALARPNS